MSSVRTLAALRAPKLSPTNWLLYGTLALILVGYFVPVATVLIQAFFTPTGLDNFVAIASDSSLIRVVWVTIAYAAIASVAAVVLTFPVAYIIANTKNQLVRRLLLASIIVPLLTSGLVRVFGWQVLLDSDIIRFFTGGTSLLYSGPGVIVGLIHVVAPLVALTLISGINSQDKALSSAAASLGAGKTALLTRVVLPLSLPAIEIALIVGFVLSVGSFATPAILGGYGKWGSMIGSDVYRQIFNQGSFGPASALTVVLLVVTVAILVVYRRLMGGRIEWLVNRSAGASSAKLKPTKKSKTATVRRRRTAAAQSKARMYINSLTRVADRRLPPVAFKLFGALLASIAAIFLLAPEVFAMPVAFTEIRALTFPPVGFSTKWFEEFFTEKWLGPVRTSFLLAVVVSMIVPILTLIAAFAAERNRKPFVRSAVLFVMLAPALIPSIASAAGYHITYSFLGMRGTFASLSIALAAMAVPFAYVVISNAVRSVDPTYERAAYSLGASYATVLRRVLLPGIARPMMVAAAIVFLMTLDESVVSVFLSAFDVQTLSAQMFSAVLDDGDPTIAVVAVLWIGGVAVVAMLAYGARLVSKMFARSTGSSIS